MSGDITVKAPVAMLVLIILVASLMVNIWKFAQPPAVVQVPVGGGGGTATSTGTPGTGDPDPLKHYPSNPRDAVGMPDATGRGDLSTGGGGASGTGGGR